MFEDQVRPVIESNTNPTYDKAQALRLYVEKSEMDILVAEDMERYKEALEETGGMVDDIEPISRFHEAFQGDVDAAYAAAVVGLETEALLEKIRENAGLQNAGLLVLASANGSMKRDAWTDSFGDIIFALDFPESFTPPAVQTPTTPGAVVRIPDSNLRAAIAEALGKSRNVPITVGEMEGLTRLEAPNRGIQDLTGLQFATNVTFLHLDNNEISNLSPIAGLTNLRFIILHNNPVSNLLPLRGLKNLDKLWMSNTSVSDLSPLAGLINLEGLTFSDNNISDLSPLAGLINLHSLSFSTTPISDISPLSGLISLEKLRFNQTSVSDLSPVAGLVNLKDIDIWGHNISDLSPLAGLTKLEKIDFCGGNISNLTPLAGLTGLKELYIASEKVSDISPLAGLTGLTRLSLEDNDISDISPLAGLTNLEWLKFRENDILDISPLAGLTQLEWLDLRDNDISDISPLAGLTQLNWLNLAHNNIADLASLDGLRENIKLIWFDNPAFPKGGPKIEGPWLWVVFPDAESDFDNGIDLLSKASDGTVAEAEIATHGAAEGKSVGEEVWTSHRLPPTGDNNINDMLKPSYGSVIYGTVSLHSPREQNTTMYVGNNDGLKVWLNGSLIYEVFGDFGRVEDYNDFFPVTLQLGINVLLVAVFTRSETSAFFGFEPGPEYTVLNAGVSYALSPTPIHTGDTFTLDISARDIFDFAGWQFDIVFNPTILEAIDISEGDFLKMGSTTLFQSGSIDNVTGKITGLSAARLSSQGVTGTGTLVQVRFKAKSTGDTQLTLQNFQFGDVTGTLIAAGPHQIRITVEEGLATGDVNRDGVVSILDLILIAQQLGRRVPAGSPVDLNGDGVVSILDLILTARSLGNTTASAAPVALNPDLIGTVGAESIDPAMIEAWIAQARLEDDGSLAFKQGIEILERLLASLIPKETVLLHNYPNPFNPETWIPYQLAQSVEVTLTIYDMNGEMIRRLALGHQAAGMYRSRSRAIYWDGRNQLGESVASGLYFYTLTADDFTATRRMLILK